MPRMVFSSHLPSIRTGSHTDILKEVQMPFLSRVKHAKMLPKISKVVLAILAIIIVCIALRGRDDSPRLAFYMPRSYSGFIFLCSNNVEMNERLGRDVIVVVKPNGKTSVNKKYLTDWHAFKFVGGKNDIPYWHESKLPQDNAVRVFEIPIESMEKTIAESHFENVNSVFFVGSKNGYQAAISKMKRR